MVAAHQAANICHGYTRGTGPAESQELISDYPAGKDALKQNGGNSRRSFSANVNGSAVSIDMP